MRTATILTPLLMLALSACSDLGAIGPGPGSGDDDPGPGAGPDAGEAASTRVQASLIGQYLFDERQGTVVNDSSLGTPLTLIIEDSAAAQWMPLGGLNIVSPTVISSIGPATKISTSCMASNAITVEVWVRPAAVNQNGPARIITVSSGNNTRNFTLAQADTLVDVRLRTTDTDENGTPELRSDIAAFDGQIMHIAYTRSGLTDEASIWVNGQLNGSETIAGSFSNWDSNYQLTIANELGGERPWRGEIYLAAVYCRALTASEIWQNYEAGY